MNTPPVRAMRVCESTKQIRMDGDARERDAERDMGGFILSAKGKALDVDVCD